MKVIKWLDEHFEETFLVFFLVLISCITMLQIIARTFFAALSWPEEFCRYCWIWSVFISLPYPMRKGNMLRVNVLVDLLPTKARNAINIVIDLINTVVMALFFILPRGIIFTAANAPTATIKRHAAIAEYLIIMPFLLFILPFASVM